MAKNTEQAFESIRIVGGLLSTKVLQDSRLYNLPGQGKSDYKIEPGLSFNEEIGRYWRIAQGRWKEYQQQIAREDINSNTLAQQEWLIPLFNKVLGYEVVKTDAKLIGEREFPITHTSHNDAITMVLCGANYDLDKGNSQFGQEGRKRSPMGLAQEYLNAENSSLWAIVSNGIQLRLLRDNPAMTRPAYIEVDFTRLFDEDNYADFATLWLLLHATRIAPQQGQVEQCWLEQWRDKGQDEGERALDKLRYGVADALRQLGTGFVAHKDNKELREKLSSGQLTTDAYFQQILRLVYRFLFMLTAEDRDVLLLPEDFEGKNHKLARQLYQKGYSIARLREKARQNRHYDNHTDDWQQLKITFDGFAKGQEVLAQPALGGLFATDQCANLVESTISNRYLINAIFNLCYFEHSNTLSRINYRDMDTEEFGSVYESLLELVPQLITEGQWQFSFMGDAEDEKAASGHSRKLTGSYYTPDSLVQELIKSALVPVIEDRLKANPQQPREAILSITVCDPACGSGHFLLAAARRLASELAKIDAGTDQPTEQNYRHALRDVVRHCIHGVDLNPMAVELCKTGLWLESIEVGKPLSFLNQRIVQGNSLISTSSDSVLKNGIDSSSYKKRGDDSPEVIKSLLLQNKYFTKKLDISSKIYSQKLNFDSGEYEENTIIDVSQINGLWDKYLRSKEYKIEKLKRDMIVSPFFMEKNESNKNLIPTNSHLNITISNEEIDYDVRKFISETSEKHGVIHWDLMFPHVFNNGGFDVILGNPPWDVVKLENNKQIVEYGFEGYKAWLSIGDYSTIKGKKDLYKLFLILSTKIMNKTGRLGLVLPIGFLIEDSTTVIRKILLGDGSIESCSVYQNERKRFFKSVHSSYLFSTFCYSFKDPGYVNYSVIKTHVSSSVLN